MGWNSVMWLRGSFCACVILVLDWCSISMKCCVRRTKNKTKQPPQCLYELKNRNDYETVMIRYLVIQLTSWSRRRRHHHLHHHQQQLLSLWVFCLISAKSFFFLLRFSVSRFTSFTSYIPVLLCPPLSHFTSSLIDLNFHRNRYKSNVSSCTESITGAVS